MNARLVSRLRSSGVALLGGGAHGLHRRVIADWLGDAGVPIVGHLTALGQELWSDEHPDAPVIVFDHGILDVAVDLVERLERNARRDERARPIVIVVSNALARRGLADLGWTRPTHRVGFARTEHLPGDVEKALTALLATEPEAPVDAKAAAAGRARLGEIDTVARSEIDALARDLDAIAWASPVSAREGMSLVVRCTLAETDHGELLAPSATGRPLRTRSGLGATVRFALRGDAAIYSSSLLAAMVPASAFFSAHRPRGLAGVIEQLRGDPEIEEPGFDNEFVVDADERGLFEARAQAALVARAARSLESIEWDDLALAARAERLGRAAAVENAGALLDLWRALVRARLGFAI